MHPQANSQNIAPEAPNRPAPQERGLGQQADQLSVQSPEQQVAPAVERGAHQPAGQAVANSLQAPQAAVSPLNVAPAMQQVAAVVPTSAPVVASSDKIEKPWIDRADEIMHTKAQDPYAEEEAHEELSAQYLKQRFNIDIKRSDPQH